MPPSPRHPTQSTLNHTLAGVPGAHSAIQRRRSILRTRSTPPSPEDAQAEALLDLAVALVDSAIEILEEHIRDDKQLRMDSRLMPGGTVGKHFRHVIETFQAFLLPLTAGPSISSSAPISDRHNDLIEMNYDAILPSTRHDVARSLSVCRSAMRGVREGLIKWEEGVAASVQDDTSGSSSPGSGSLSAGELEPAGNGIAGEVRRTGLAAEMDRPVRLIAITPSRQVLLSSVGRELWFTALHAIHHFSMLRTIAVHELNLELPIEFGTAPSTILYREKSSNRRTKASSPRSRVRSKL